jgi:mannose-6-phosphate isomerase-like protein (cupin superfamily)
MRHFILRTALATLLLLVPGSGRPSGSDDAPAPIARVDEIRAAHPIPEGESFTTQELLRGGGVSSHLVQVRSRLRPQIHREHEEMAYLLSGRGVFVIGDRVYPVKAGALMLIPRGVVHSFEAKEPSAVLAIFNPPFDPEDRVFVDASPPSP